MGLLKEWIEKNAEPVEEFRKRHKIRRQVKTSAWNFKKLKEAVSQHAISTWTIEQFCKEFSLADADPNAASTLKSIRKLLERLRKKEKNIDFEIQQDLITVYKR